MSDQKQIDIKLKIHLDLIFTHERKILEAQFSNNFIFIKRELLTQLSNNDVSSEDLMMFSNKEIINLVDDTLYSFSKFCLEEARKISWDLHPLHQVRDAAWAFFDHFKQEIPHLYKGQDDLISSATKYMDTLSAPKLSEILKIAEYDWPTSHSTSIFKKKYNTLLEQKNEFIDKKIRLPERFLMKWWNSISDSRNNMSDIELHKSIRDKYPKNFVSRERMRTLRGSRKTGPKPFR